jgi:periplasmic divalent cation tolerance protein
MIVACSRRSAIRQGGTWRTEARRCGAAAWAKTRHTGEVAGGSMTDKVVILVTVANRREGRRIARHLVENRLAACVNMTQTIQSIYRWEGKLVEDEELLLVIKSARPLFPEIKTAITQIHTYHTPEIICLPIIEGSENYLQWMSDSVKGSDKR